MNSPTDFDRVRQASDLELERLLGETFHMERAAGESLRRAIFREDSRRRLILSADIGLRRRIAQGSPS
jgi:hypothetical protein